MRLMCTSRIKGNTNGLFRIFSFLMLILVSTVFSTVFLATVNAKERPLSSGSLLDDDDSIFFSDYLDSIDQLTRESGDITIRSPPKRDGSTSASSALTSLQLYKPPSNDVLSGGFSRNPNRIGSHDLKNYKPKPVWHTSNVAPANPGMLSAIDHEKVEKIGEGLGVAAQVLGSSGVAGGAVAEKVLGSLGSVASDYASRGYAYTSSRTKKYYNSLGLPCDPRQNKRLVCLQETTTTTTTLPPMRFQKRRTEYNKQQQKYLKKRDEEYLKKLHRNPFESPPPSDLFKDLVLNAAPESDSQQNAEDSVLTSNENSDPIDDKFLQSAVEPPPPKMSEDGILTFSPSELRLSAPPPSLPTQEELREKEKLARMKERQFVRIERHTLNPDTYGSELRKAATNTDYVMKDIQMPAERNVAWQKMKERRRKQRETNREIKRMEEELEQLRIAADEVYSETEHWNNRRKKGSDLGKKLY